MNKYRQASDISSPKLEDNKQAVAEIVASYIVRMCGNALADVHVNHGRYLPAGAQKALHTAVVELTRFDQELIIGLGPGAKKADELVIAVKKYGK